MATKVLGKQSGKNKEKKAPTDKPKSTKSRFGCLTCKKRRLKCDETKPLCINCLKKKVECGGYATNFKWMAFKDDNEDTKPKPTSGPKTFKEHLELASISVTGKSIKEIKQENDLISQGLNPDSYKKRKSSVGIEQGDDSQIMKRPRSCSYEPPENSPSAEERMGILRSLSANTPIPTEIHDFRSEYSKSSHNLNSLAEVAIDEINKSPGPPSNISMKEPSSPGGQVPFSPGFSDFMKLDRDKHHDVSLTPSLTALINFACNNNDPKSNFDLDNFKLNSTGPMSPFNLNSLSHLDEHHTHTNTKSSTHISGVGMTIDPISGPSSISASSPSSQPTHGSVSDTLAGKIKLLSATNSPIESINSPPSVLSDSPSHRSLMKTSDQEQILHLYSLYTCTIMSIKNGTDENPWRNMILPLASKYSCLFNSIASMTLFHLAGNHELASTAADLRAKGFDYMKRCIVDLATGLSRSRDSETKLELPADIALATCLNLAVGESWDTQISSGIAHLKGAKSMIQEILNLLKEQQSRISKKKLQWSSSPSPDENEYQELILSQKSEMLNKLVLLDNSEWERIVNQSEEGASGENEKSSKSNAITVPKSLQFLFNIWIYFEVLAQMTTDTNNDDKGIDLVATITTMLQSPRNQKNQEVKSRKTRQVDSECASFSDPASPSLKSDSGELNASGESGSRNGFNIFDSFESFSHNSEYVDPLLGCAQSLFLLMGRVAALISKIRKARKMGTSNRNSLSTITAAAALKQELNEWKPTITPSMIQQANSRAMYDDNGSGTWDISSCIATAEAYKYATLIYLHQAVPEIPSLSSHQLAEKIFILMASIPTTSHLYVVHIFPLLVGSCEAEPGEEREWCEARWELLSQRMWIGNIDKALEVVKEVWLRKDEYSNKRRRSEAERDELKFKINSGDDQDGRLRNISSQLTGLMSVVNNLLNSSVEDIIGGITSPFHWSTVMKEWGWEVLLG